MLQHIYTLIHSYLSESYRNTSILESMEYPPFLQFLRCTPWKPSMKREAWQRKTHHFAQHEVLDPMDGFPVNFHIISDTNRGLKNKDLARIFTKFPESGIQMDSCISFLFFPLKTKKTHPRSGAPFNLSSRTFFELAMLPPCRGPNSTSWGETCVDSRAQGNGTSIWGAKGWGWWLVNRTFSPSVFPLRNKGLNDWGKPISLIRPLIRCYFSGGVALGLLVAVD